MKIGSEGFWKITGGAAGLLILLAVLIAANVIVKQVRLRKDFTEEKLYSLSKGSRAIVGKLDQNVTLKLFFNSSSAEVPPFLKNYEREVEDLLHEYALAAGKKITIEKYDPQPDSDAEEWAQKYGIPGNPVQIMGQPIYFGLVAVCGSAEGVIPTLDPRTQELLEYNVTRLIYRVTHPEKPVVGLMSSLPVLGGPNPEMAMMMGGQKPAPPWAAFRDLREDYDVKEAPIDSGEISGDIKALILVHPKELKDKTLYAIDQFVLRGGRLLVFLDPFCISDAEASQPSPMGMPRISSNIEKLLTAWGVSFEENKVLADLGATTKIRGADGQVEDSPLFLRFGENNLNRKDIVTAQINLLMLPFAGTFSCSPSKDMTVTPLITSGDKSCGIDSMAARFGSQAIRSGFKSGGIKLDAAVRLSGKFKTAFPEGKPKDADATNTTAQAESKPSLKEGESTVILVGDTDMLYDRFCVEELNFFGAKAYRPMNDNVNFFANSLEQVAGSQDLVGIRCRGKFDRPFDRVLALQEKAMQEWQKKENDLEAELKDTQQQLGQLESTKDKSQRFILSNEQKKAIADFKAKELEIKKELKLVRRNLRSDIERLGIKVKVINIALMPALVCAAGIGFWLHRRNKK